jgi:hypothetical protein
MHDPHHNHEGLTPRLKCEIDLELSGPDVESLEKWAAASLIKLAERLALGNFEDGFTDVTDRVGKKIGTIYVDYFVGTF